MSIPTDNAVTETNTNDTMAKTITLGEQSNEQNRIPTKKGVFSKIKGLGKKSGLREKINNLQEADSRSIAERTFQLAERGSAEATSFVSGLTKLAVAGSVGLVGGALSGGRALTGQQLKAIRLKSEELQQIGRWIDVEDEKGEQFLVAHLHELGEDVRVRIPLASVGETTITEQVDGEKVRTEAVAISVEEYDELIVASQQTGTLYSF